MGHHEETNTTYQFPTMKNELKYIA
jgi:hypothetical protein